MTAAMSRSDALTAIPSARTRQASFTTGKNIISTMSLSGNFTSCPHSISKELGQGGRIGLRRGTILQCEYYATAQNITILRFTIAALDLITSSS
jgi:hypothetical protein